VFLLLKILFLCFFTISKTLSDKKSPSENLKNYIKKLQSKKWKKITILHEEIKKT